MYLQSKKPISSDFISLLQVQRAADQYHPLRIRPQDPCYTLILTLGWGVISILVSFLKVKVQNGGYFWGLIKCQIFLGVLEIPDIFFLWGGGGVDGRCWA